MSSTTYTMNLRPTGYEALSVTNAAAVGFTAAKLTPAVMGVFCTVETATVRFRMDGSDPTTSEGHELESGQTLTIYNRTALPNIKFIAESTTAPVRVTYLSE